MQGFSAVPAVIDGGGEGAVPRTGARSPAHGTALDNAPGSPIRSANEPSACKPTWPPASTRLIVRREPLHPGAQRPLFDSETYRYWGHWTDQPGTPVELDVSIRAHARVEDHVCRLEASGLERFPFTDLHTNRAWLASVAMAADLVAWFQLLCLAESLATAEPKTLRWRFWHTPARVTRHSRRHVIRLLDGWPDTTEILAAYGRIAT